MLTSEQKNIMTNYIDMLCRQIDKFNKKGDISPDELKRSADVFDIVKDYEVICAMEDYGRNPEEELYSSTGYYGRNSRTNTMPIYGRYSPRGYSRDDAASRLHRDLEMKLNAADNEEERQMIRRCMDALNR